MVFAVASAHCQSIIKYQFLIAKRFLQIYNFVSRILSPFSQEHYCKLFITLNVKLYAIEEMKKKT